MTLYKFAAIGLIVIIFSSCQSVMKLAYGIKNPTVQNSNDVIKSAIALSLDTSKVYSLTYDAYIDRTLKNGEAPVHIEIFSSNGLLVVPNDTAISECSGRIADYLTTMDDSSYYYLSDSIGINRYLQGLVTINGKELSNLPVTNANFIAVINWASYAGRLNNKISTWSQSLQDHQSVTFDIIYVNLDFRDFWGDVPMLR
jgi:hypothetical protein